MQFRVFLLSLGLAQTFRWWRTGDNIQWHYLAGVHMREHELTYRIVSSNYNSLAWRFFSLSSLLLMLLKMSDLIPLICKIGYRTGR